MPGQRPPIDYLERWMDKIWGPLGLLIETAQVLPKGYNMFPFKEKEMALKMLGVG